MPISKNTRWTTRVFTKELKRLSRDVLGTDVEIGVQLYRQLSITITERHVRGALPTFDRFDDMTAAADPDVAFAWQSGHRPKQRYTNYGLDGAYPDKLQPPLLIPNRLMLPYLPDERRGCRVFLSYTETSLYVMSSISRTERGNALPFPLPAYIGIHPSVLP
jgi:hypothetical protein